MKVFGIIVLIAVALAVIGGMGDSDSDDSTSSSPSAAVEQISSDADETLALSEEGGEISARLGEWAAEGGRNPMDACASLGCSAGGCGAPRRDRHRTQRRQRGGHSGAQQPAARDRAELRRCRGWLRRARLLEHFRSMAMVLRQISRSWRSTYSSSKQV